MKQPAFAFESTSLVVAPSPHLAARETSALAAVENLPHRATQSARILALITEAGAAGMSDAELARVTGYCRSAICARRGDLAPFLAVAARRDVSPFGRSMCCWRRRSPAEMEATS